MRWSEFSGKECIDLLQGEKLGSLSHGDLSFDPQTGIIDSLFIATGSSWFRKQEEVKIAWKMIRKVGPEMVIVESKPHPNRHR